MNTKLTLTIDKALIEKAKRHAKQKGRSLSDIVENYLKVLTNAKNDQSIDQSPVTSSLRGTFNVPEEFDYKEVLSESLLEKHHKNG